MGAATLAAAAGLAYSHGALTTSVRSAAGLGIRLRGVWSGLLRGVWILALAAIGAVIAPRQALAAPGDREAREGLAAAKKNDCVTAVPLLEDAELARHTPTTASALAGCYVALGELLKASELYHAIAAEKPARSWTRTDRSAAASAAQKAEDVDARIPTVSFKPAQSYPGLEIAIDGRALDDPSAPRKILPDVSITITSKATGYRKSTQRLILGEGERRTIAVKLTAEVESEPEPEPILPVEVPSKGSKHWLGARFRGLTIPRFVMNIPGEGGTTVFSPGVGATLTTPAGADADVVISLGYQSYRLGETPFKPNDTPDTEYEIIESDLQALYLTVDLLYNAPLDADGDVVFRIGGGAGVGFMVFGDLIRTQAYPPDGANGDPYLYAKCNGPNDPAGSFRYCNQLDKDRDHYDGYAEPSWFDGGARPLIFPWVAFPEVGLSFRVSPRFMIDLEVALTLSGILTGVGFRVGL